ncbi:MAG: glycine--tRNA ligase subunit alpha [Methylacidiphilales bacterium]|nr:glycine--tRNA ligase subunit alpha [Candidatus Methylacidiphilales bacterium]
MSLKDVTFQDLLIRLKEFWSRQGCVIAEPFDMPMGAGTFHPETFIRSIGKKPWSVAYLQPCRRPTDGRYGENPNRLGKYFQFQVLIKPAPVSIQDIYIKSLEMLGLHAKHNDIRFVEDNWESPALGAWGLGWEVWCNGMEVTQFTYFQQVGGVACNPVSVEITYGCERLAMYLQGVNSVYDIVWHKNKSKQIFYRDIFLSQEQQHSFYNFEAASIDILSEQFKQYYSGAQTLFSHPLVAYEHLLNASHTFNILDSRGAFSVNQRQHHLLQIRTLAKEIASEILKQENDL